MNNESIKKFLLHKRVENGLSQAEIASLLNISQTSYHKIEKGSTYLISEKLEQIATILGVTKEEIIFGHISDTTNRHILGEMYPYYANRDIYFNQSYDKLIEEKELRIKELESILRDKNEIIQLLNDKHSR